MALKVGLIGGDISREGLLDLGGRWRGGHHQRTGLGADHVVGGGDAAAGPIGQAGIVDQLQGQGGGAQVEQPAQRRPLGLGGPGQGPAQDRQHSRRRTHGRRHGGWLAGSLGALRRPNALLGLAHQRNHPFVALFGRGPKGEEAVLEQHHALELNALVGGAGGRLLVGGGGGQGQVKAGHHIGHQGNPIAIDLAANRFGIGLVGQGQQGNRMGVVDVGVGQEGMQQGLHRRIGGGRIDQVLALGRHHRLIAEALQGPQGLQGLQAHGRMAGGLDRGQVPARSLHAEHGDRFAQQPRHRGFNRGVAAAMEHQVWIGPEQAGRVGA